MVSSRVKQKKSGRRQSKRSKQRKSRQSRSRSRSRRRSGKKIKPVVYHRDATDGVRGWDAIKPKRRSERRKLMDLCGSQCFGSPKTLGFPVCPVHIKDPSQCGADCKGLLAAYSRARQWREKHPGLATKLKKRAQGLKCKWTRR